MGDVWRGEDEVLGRIVAVKILRSSLNGDPDFRERFRREARALAALDGPGIAEVYDYGEIHDSGRDLAFLVMQYVDGDSLARRLALDGRLSTAETLRVVGAVAEALHIAHQAGIIHRDVKPGNIILAEDGRVMLVDFGISRVATNLTMTHTGVVLGTVTYMSPEQATGDKLGPPSDVYSLGVVAYQCLAGTPPFKINTPLGVLSAHMSDTATPLPAETSEAMRALLAKAMASDADHRYASAADFAAACRQTALNPGASLILSGRLRRATPASRAPMVPAQRVDTPTPTGPPQIRAVASAPGGVSPPEPPNRMGPRRRRHAAERRGPRLNFLVLALLGFAIVLIGTSVTMMAPWRTGELAEKFNDDTSTPVSGSSVAVGQSAGLDGTLPAPSAGDAESTASPSPKPSSSASTATPSPSPSLVAVPDVIGMSEEAARQRLEERGLVPEVSYVGEGPQPCQVTGQDPQSGAQAPAGSTVTVIVHKGETCAM